jgi:hypothetical protein
MLKELQQIHRRIAEVARRIAKQQQIVAKLVRLDRDTSQARVLLATLSSTRVEYEYRREMLITQIVNVELRNLRN